MPKRVASHVKRWFSIANKHPDIRAATEPRFSCQCFIQCDDFRNMASWLSTGRWCIGQSFYYLDLCLVNQADGGDDWMVIKGSRVISVMHCTGQDVEELAVLLRALHATPEEVFAQSFIGKSIKKPEYDAD